MVIIRRFGILALGVVFLVVGFGVGLGQTSFASGCVADSAHADCPLPPSMIIHQIVTLGGIVVGLLLIGAWVGFAIARRKHCRPVTQPEPPLSADTPPLG
jgi:ABC-type xylose transport system permease subunit